MIENLETLVALCQHQTMLKTGTALRITQSAVSKRIATLEHSYGQKLIERSGQNVVLTEAGNALVQKVRPLLAGIREALRTHVDQSRPAFEIGVSESVLSSWGANLLARAATRNNLSIQLHAHRSPLVVDRVNSGEFDLGLCAGRISKGVALISEPLIEEEMVVIPSSGSRKRPSTSKTMTVITIEPRSATWRSISKPLGDLAVRVDRTLESFFAIAQLARAGMGHALVPMGVARTLTEGKGHLVRFKPRLERPIQLLYRKSRLTNPVFREFVAKLHEQAGLIKL